jgi:hypothetical protein
MDQLQRAAARHLPDFGTRLTLLAGTAAVRELLDHAQQLLETGLPGPAPIVALSRPRLPLRARSQWMNAPTRAGINVPKWKYDQPLAEGSVRDEDYDDWR